MLITGSAVKAPLVTHQSNKLKYKEELFHDIVQNRLDRIATKKELLEAVSLIVDRDPHCPKPPKSYNSKTEIYSWLIDNLQTYFNFLDQEWLIK